MKTDELLNLLGIGKETIPNLDQYHNKQDCIDAISNSILKLGNLAEISVTECLEWLFLYKPWEVSFPGLKYTKLKQQWLKGELDNIPDEEALAEYQNEKVKEFRGVLSGLLHLLKEGLYKLDTPFYEKLFLNDKLSIKLEKSDYYIWLLTACIRNLYHDNPCYGLPNTPKEKRDYALGLLIEYLKSSRLFRERLERENG